MYAEETEANRQLSEDKLKLGLSELAENNLNVSGVSILIFKK